MTDNLTEAKGILTDLESNIEQQAQALRDRYSNQEPPSDLDECLQKRKTRSWLHGATDIDESIVLEEWLHANPLLSELAKSPAKNIMRRWRSWLEKQEAYYDSFATVKFTKSHKDETLFDFCLRVAQLIEEKGTGLGIEWRALKSFFNYLRIAFPHTERAFLEHIFPEKMDIFSENIIRKVAPEVYHIPEDAAAAILIELARIARNERANAQYTALESLGLCWICLTASRIRLPAQLAVLQKIEPGRIILGDENQQPVLKLPTLFGDIEVKISHRIAKFLLILAEQPSKKPRDCILQSPPRSLSRCLDRALENIGLNTKFGNITFTTLISPPHPFSNRRYKLK